MKFEYYYNNVPNEGLCRNNLIYTSLVNENKTVFVQWYNNDTDYHKGQNQIVDKNLMEEKWNREVKYLEIMQNAYPNLIPKILDIDLKDKKIYLEIQGVDFWQQSLDNRCEFDKVLPDWQNQMLDIIKAHHSLKLRKYSMHPSSYFIVDGKLKSINYFFTYHESEGPITIEAHQSHLSEHRKNDLKSKVESLGMSWTSPTSLKDLEFLCWESFKTNYPTDFIRKAQDLL